MNFTSNGAMTLATSTNANVDLFFQIGASRGTNISDMFAKALEENTELALRILLWARDIRGGAGERQTFRDLANTLDPLMLGYILHKIPELGRWDDLLPFIGKSTEAVQLITDALQLGNGLCAKWMPRQDSKGAKPIRKALGLTPKEYRKLLVSLSNTVEQKMCVGDWESIDFSKLPSKAAAMYQNAFNKHAPENYLAYKESLVSGDTKVNAAAIYPHDIIISMLRGDEIVADAQWKTQPDYLEGSTKKILPVADVSGSMKANGVNHIAIALAIYLAERSESNFKNKFISFSSDPHFHSLTGDSLFEKYFSVNRSGEDMGTDLIKVFETLLEFAILNKVKQEDMPDSLAILTDMGFDEVLNAELYRKSTQFSENVEVIKTKYANAGYECPQLIFWNLHGTPGNVPVSAVAENTVLVSGFSPSVMKGILKGGTTPLEVMLDIVMDERYNPFS